MGIFSSKKQVKELETALMGGYAFSKLKDEVQIHTILTCIYKRLHERGCDDPEEKFNTTPAIVQGGFFANAMAELDMPHGVSGFSWTFIPNPFSLVVCSQKVTLKALNGIRNLGIDPIKECFPEQPEDNKMIVKDGIKHGQDTYTYPSGKKYVGSAYGGSGIWSRWSCYIETGHGGNDELTKIIKAKDDNYAIVNFRLSLLEYRSMKVDDNVIKERESYWKEVFLSRGQFGYNKN